MRLKFFSLAILCCAAQFAIAQEPLKLHPDTVRAEDLILKSTVADSVMQEYMLGLMRQQAESIAHRNDSLQRVEQLRRDSAQAAFDLADRTTLVPLHLSQKDSLRIAATVAARKGAHPLLKELIFMPIDVSLAECPQPDFATLYFGASRKIPQPLATVPQLTDPDAGLADLHAEVRRRISREHADLYCGTFLTLPDVNTLAQNSYLRKKKSDDLLLAVDHARGEQQIKADKIELSKWQRKGTALLQFTQNYISKNWYKGGNSNVAVLGILSGNYNYDNHKNLQWENTGEWRMGFNSVTGDTLRKISTNEDLFKLNSKLGLRAFGKFYYTASFEFQTQFFNTYTGINSTKCKTAFFAPLRVNAGLGLDYKHSKNLSIVFSPIAYKYIFVGDTIKIDQTAFGVVKGMRELSELGSSLKVTYTYKPVPEIQIDSRFYCYTNYTKVELELEMVANFIINRYLSTRVSLYPRYDSTVILNGKDHAQLQFKELISVGFSHTFL